MKSKILNNYYKEHLNGYRSWNQLSHADDVCRYLMKLPEGKRRMVKNVTLDMAGIMRQIAKRCFPYATQIINRFHVQMQMQEALQELRVQYRWQAIKQENSDIKRARAERREYIPQCFENGDTLRQLIVRSRYLLFKSPDKWTNSQKIRAEILFKQFDDIKQLYYLTLQLGQTYSKAMIRMLQG